MQQHVKNSLDGIITERFSENVLRVSIFVVASIMRDT